MIHSHEPDILGAPYVAESIPLGQDEDGYLEATLVARPCDSGETRRAVLHVHGFCDYFFHTEYAEWWTARGYDFYALDLRRYGRSLRKHQLPGYTTDVHEYFEELDEAWRLITERDGHDQVVLSAHSTGGLTVPLWADARREQWADGVRPLGMVLNSPWVDMHGPFWLRTAGTALVKQVGSRQPRREIPRGVSGLYGQSLYDGESGEWHYDLEWKPLTSWPIHFGWLAAIRRGHAELHRGIDVGCPVLVLVSSRTTRPTAMGEDVHTSDIVLDVQQIRRWSTMLSPHVTVVSVDKAIHDVVLSRPDVRVVAYDELTRWLNAYVPVPEVSERNG